MPELVDEGRRRAARLDVVSARLARSFAAPFQKRLAAMNAKTAHLRGLAMRGIPVSDRVDQLHVEVAAEAAEFSRNRHQLTGASAQESLLRDVQRSYQQLLRQLADTRHGGR